MKLSLDATTDYSYEELHRFLDVNTIPDFVKQGECLTKVAADELPDDSFADLYHRAFPINTPSNLYVSNAYFMNKRAALEEMWGKHYVNGVQQRIDKAAEVLDIKKDIEAYNADLLKKESADYTEKNLISIDDGGDVYDLFPYKTAEDLAYHAHTFGNTIGNYPFAWRQKIAEAFVKTASELGLAELPDIIAKYGGMFLPDVREFESTLQRRMRKLSGTHVEQYEKVLEKAASISSRQDAMDVCEQAYFVEKRAGVYDKPALYREMGDIVDRTMTLDFEKVAEQFNVVKMDNDCYRISDLQKISKEIYKEAFGCDIDPSNANELREVLPTMPGSDVALFRHLTGIASC